MQRDCLQGKFRRFVDSHVVPTTRALPTFGSVAYSHDTNLYNNEMSIA
jgi:hypothetical protein